MAIYKTYQEAVIASGSVKGVHTDGKWFYTDGTEQKLYNIKPCSPADHLETLADFHARGLRLVDGDYYIRLDSSIATIGDDITVYSANDPLSSNDRRFVLKAAAYDTETPEEKEAFESMTDTAPQQFESLSSSEKPNNSEWNGKGLPPVGELFLIDNYDTVLLCKYSSEYAVIGEMIEYNHPEGMEVVIDLKQTPNRKFSKPETPEQRAERERLEAAYELYLNECAHARYLPGKIDAVDLSFYLRIVDKTGYRKQ